MNNIQQEKTISIPIPISISIWIWMIPTGRLALKVTGRFLI
jgi:hypothetical protein